MSRFQYKLATIGKLLTTICFAIGSLSISQARSSESALAQQPTVIDWPSYWNLSDWHYAQFQNYVWENNQWTEQVGKRTAYGIAPRTSIPKYDEPGEWDNVWRLQFLKPEDC